MLSMVFILPSAIGNEAWRVKIHYGLTGETVCGMHRFPNEDSCNRAKDWFEQQSRWHADNTYQCVLESHCPQH